MGREGAALRDAGELPQARPGPRRGRGRESPAGMSLAPPFFGKPTGDAAGGLHSGAAGGAADEDRGVHWRRFPDLLAPGSKAEWLERTRRPANETYDAGLSLDVDRCIADNFVNSPGLGKHRHMA